MTRSRRLVLLIITFLPLVVLLASSLIFLKAQIDDLARRANVLIAGELQHKLKREVKVGAANVREPGVAVLRDVHVANGKTLREGELVAARKVIVRYDWRALIFAGKGANSVSEILIFDPNVLVIRRRDGAFNVAELLKFPPGPKRPPFMGKVKIIDGKAVFYDHAVRPNMKTSPVHISDLSGTLDAAKYPIYEFKVAARGAKNEFGIARAHGRYYKQNKKIYIQVAAKGVSAPRLTPYAWKSKSVQVLGGILDLDATLNFNRTNGRYKTAVSGSAHVSNATLRMAMLKSNITNVTGRVDIDKTRASGILAGSFAGAFVRANGSIANFANPKFDLTLDSASVDVSKLIDSTKFLGGLSEFNPSGRGPIHARLRGAPTNLIVEATARIPRASIKGAIVSDVAVSAKYSPNAVDIKSLKLTAQGAKVNMSGRVALRPVAILALAGRFENLDARRVPVDARFAASGLANGVFSLAGPASNPIISVDAGVSNGSVGKVKFSSVNGSLSVVGSRVKINNFRIAGVFDGAIEASGIVSGNSFELDVAAESVDVASLARIFAKQGYSGTAFFNGRVFGDMKSPHVQGMAEVFDAGIEGYSIDHAMIALSADNNSVSVSEGLVQSYPAELRFSGDASGLSTGRVTFAGNAHVRRLEMTKMLDLIKRDLDVTGTIIGDFSFAGTYLPKSRPGEKSFQDVTAYGDLSLEDAVALGYPVNTASAKLEYSSNVLKLSQASVTSDGSRVDLMGSLNTDTQIVDASFDLKGFELARLQDVFGDYFALSGVGSVIGNISGALDNMKGVIDAKVDGLAINYEKFDRAEAHFVYDDGMFSSFSVSAARAGQSLDLSGTNYNPQTNCLASLNGLLTDISVPDVLAIVRASPFFASEEGKPIMKKLDDFPRLTSGRVNGMFSASGCLVSPDGEFILPDGKLSLIATNVGVDVQKIDTLELKAFAQSGVVGLEKFELVYGDAGIVASGERAYENGKINIDVKADNVALSDISRWFGSAAPLGTVSAVFNIAGAVSAPEMIGSIEIIKPGYGAFSFDRLRASSVQITSNRIEIPDLILTARGHQLSVMASVPWNWSNFTVPRDKPIALSADMSNQDISVLSVIAPVVDQSKTNGLIEAGRFSLTGTLLDPQMTGALKVNGATVAIKNFTNTFTNVTADMVFSGDRVDINALSAVSSEGGNLYVVPGGYATIGISGGGEVNFAIVADRLAVGEKNLFGFKEDVYTQIDAGLSVIGPIGSPTVADAAVGGKRGGIILSRGEFSFESTSKLDKSLLLALPVDPTFKVSLKLGNDIEIDSPGMSMVVSGDGSVSGTLSRPHAELGLNIDSGEINLATARLRVTPGGTIRIAYDYPNPPTAVVDFQSVASVFAINTIGQRERYKITVNVTGQATKPQINLTSDPPGLTHTQMLAALGHVPALFTSAEAGLQSELANVLTSVGASAILAPIENIFVQKLGFEQFSLDYSPIYPLSIYVSRHMFGNFYISFYRQLTGSFAGTQDVLYQVVLSYRLKRIYQISIGADNQQTLTFQIGYAKAFR